MPKVMLLLKYHLPIYIFVLTGVGNGLGSYIVEVTVHSYQNPTGRCVGCQSGQEAGCCDDPQDFIRPANQMCSTTRVCDTGLSYCAIPIGEACDREDMIPSTQLMFNTNSIDFDSRGSLLGLDNPVVVEREESWNGIEFVLTPWDCIRHDSCSNANDFRMIDDVIVTIDVPVGTKSSEQTYSGVADIAEFVVSFHVRCADDHYGDDCDTQCPEFVSCEDCGLPGYTGEFCQFLPETCNEEYCNGNGECVDGSSVCNCEPGFTGERCEESNPQAAIAGGVAGAVVGIIIVIVIIVVTVVVIIVLWRRGHICAATKKDDGSNNPGDNPTYGVGSTPGSHPIPTQGSNDFSASVEEREFDNPIYSSDPLEEVDADEDPYTVPDSPPSNVDDRMADDNPV